MNQETRKPLQNKDFRVLKSLKKVRDLFPLVADIFDLNKFV